MIIYGHDDGAALFHKTVKLDDIGAKLVKLNLTGVDDVQFVPGAGKHDPVWSGSGSEIAFNDMTVKVTGGHAAAPFDHAGPFHADLHPIAHLAIV